MAWDLGCGDIIAGIRIALTLYEYGFVEENAPGEFQLLLLPQCLLLFPLYDDRL